MIIIKESSYNDEIENVLSCDYDDGYCRGDAGCGYDDGGCCCDD